MAVGDIVSIPANSAGVSCSKTNVAWVTPTTSTITASTADYYNLLGASISVNQVPGLNTTVEILIEIFVNSVKKVQLPYSFRMNTAVGYYHTRPYTIFLPEPHYIAVGSSVAMSITDNQALATGYSNCKLYFSVAANPSGYTPVDPFGSMGIFGI